MNPKVCYCGSFQDYSGYGGANRAFITALYMDGVDITTKLVTQVHEHTDHDWQGRLASRLQDRKIDYKIKTIHLTPDIYSQHMEPGKYHIGHLFWETTKLPDGWANECNKMGEIWTANENMAEVLKKSGVKVPIYWFPQPIEVLDAEKEWGRFHIPHHNGFLFYSIFQWIKRKNPEVLLKAYWKAFAGVTDVTLLLKTHRVNFDASEFQTIERDIAKWKRQVNVKTFPRVLLSKSLLTDAQMMKLHSVGDCYVQVDRGEGWSRPIQEALLLGKTVLSTARGGIHEYLKDEHYFRIPTKYVPVEEEKWVPYYTKDQEWAEPDVEKFISLMMFIYKNKTVANSKGIVAQEFIKKNFNYQLVGHAMKNRLMKIEKGL